MVLQVLLGHASAGIFDSQCYTASLSAFAVSRQFLRSKLYVDETVGRVLYTVASLPKVSV